MRYKHFTLHGGVDLGLWLRLCTVIPATVIPRRVDREPWSIITSMKLEIVVHRAEEGGFWAEVPTIPGCATQGETYDELLRNLTDAIEGCVSVDIQPERSE